MSQCGLGGRLGRGRGGSGGGRAGWRGKASMKEGSGEGQHKSSSHASWRPISFNRSQEQVASLPPGPHISAVIDDDLAQGCGGFDAVFPEDNQWYPARVISKSFRFSKVEFVGHEEDGEYEVSNDDLRPSLSEITLHASSSNSEQLQLQVKVQADATVEELKRAIEARMQTASNRIRLIHQGRELTDPTCRLYSDCSIRTRSILHLSIKLSEDNGEDEAETIPALGGAGSVENFPALSKRSTNHQPVHKKKNQKTRNPARKSAAGWWSSLEGDDVISLDPLSELSYEPFFLPASAVDESADRTRAGWVDSYNFFDGKVLSRYLVSTGNFSHPVSRRLLSRGECVRLDGYMERNGFGEAGVVHAFDLKDDKTDNGRNHLEVWGCISRCPQLPDPVVTGAAARG
eukprot:758707-Hanusia_phi.AAC.9